MKIKKIAILSLSMLTFGLTLTSCDLLKDEDGGQSLPPISDTSITPSGNNQGSETEKVTLTVMTGSSSKKYEFLKGENVKLSELTGLKKTNYKIEGFYYDVLTTEKVENIFEITGDLKIYVKYELQENNTSVDNTPSDTPTTQESNTGSSENQGTTNPDTNTVNGNNQGNENQGSSEGTPTDNTTTNPDLIEQTFNYTVAYSYKFEGETATHIYTENMQIRATTDKTAMEYYEAETNTVETDLKNQITTNYNAVDKKVTNVRILDIELYTPANYITFTIEGTNKTYSIPSGTKWDEFLNSSQTTLGKETGFSISRDEEVLYVTPNSMYIKDDDGNFPMMSDAIKPITYTIYGASEATTLSTDFWKDGAIVSITAYDYNTNQELPNQYDPFYSEEKTLCIDTSWLRDFYEDNNYNDFYIIVEFDKVYSFGMCTWYTSLSDVDYTLYVDDEITDYLYYNTHMGVTATGTDTDDLNNTRFNKLRIDISPQSGYISSGTISMKTNN